MYSLSACTDSCLKALSCQRVYFHIAVIRKFCRLFCHTQILSLHIKMFWGLGLEPGKIFSAALKSPLTITAATLDKNVAGKKQETQIWFQQNGTNCLIAVVSKTMPNIALNLNLEVGEEFIFHTVGDGMVYLSGFFRLR